MNLILVMLAVVALAILFGVDVSRLKPLLEQAKDRISPQKAAAALVLLLVFLLWSPLRRDDNPTPVPDSGPLSLSGAFKGPTASDDAATVGNLLLELADEIEWDGNQTEPSIRTGAQIDQLRKAARVLRCRGESIGERQPVARDKIAEYLVTHVGEDGGPITPTSRAAWVSAFREVGKAAADAALQ